MAQSPIFYIKNFNNCIKSCLIGDYCKPGSVVLDLCSGKSGDRAKYESMGVKHLVCADIAIGSLEDAVGRYNSTFNHVRSPSYQFIHADCFENSIIPCLAPALQFDFVSCQFALHYAFDSQWRVRQALANAASRLKIGGHFLGTIPDCNVLMRKFRESPGARFANSFVDVTWRGKIPAASDNISAADRTVYGSLAVDRADPYGYEYIFYLKDAIDSCPEFLVHFDTFQTLAAEYGLQLVNKSNFHEYFISKARQPDNRQFLELLKMHRVFNTQHTIGPDEWDVAYLYRVFVFVKTHDPNNHLVEPTSESAMQLESVFTKRKIDVSDIIHIS